jgi:hypothetical protein
MDALNSITETSASFVSDRYVRRAVVVGSFAVKNANPRITANPLISLERGMRPPPT